MRYNTSSSTIARTTLALTAAAVAFAVNAVAAQPQQPQQTHRGDHAQLTVAPSGRATTEVVLTPAREPGAAPAAGAEAPKPSVIKIDYGVPHLRGRKLHTGDLVPYDKAWRLGANNATMLTTDVDLTIGGKAVPKGRWVLQAMPSQSGWKLLVQKDAGQSPMAAAMSYDPANDIARVDLKETALQTPLESFTMWLIPSPGPGAPHGELRFAWGGTMQSAEWSVK